MHVIAAKAVAFKEALDPRFTDYQKQVLENSRTMARVLTERGLRIVSGGTDSHMFLVDLRSKKITGKEAEAALGRAQITINKNAIPDDPEKPTVTSGLRVGAAAMTTRGFGRSETVTVARFVADVLDAPAEIAVIACVRDKVQALCDAFPCTPTGDLSPCSTRSCFSTATPLAPRYGNQISHTLTKNMPKRQSPASLTGSGTRRSLF
jgi:glycine hydroxymethyltransferase